MKGKQPNHRLKQIMVSFRRGLFYLLSILAFVFTLLITFNILKWDPEIVSSVMSVSGLSLLLGLQFGDARKYANYQPLTPAQWMRSFSSIRPITGQLNPASLQAMALRAHGIVSSPANSTTEGKMVYLLEKVNSLQGSVEKLDENIRSLDESRKKDIDIINKELKGLNKLLSSQIAGHIVGDFDKNFFAIIVTIGGTIIQIFR